MFTFTNALVIACHAHEGQKDKGGEDYIKHPLHVAFMCKQKGYSKETQIVAILHDVLEDSNMTIEELERYGVPESVLMSLKLLTHDESESYESYIEKIKTDEMARKVKIEDLTHNSDLSRIPHEKFKDHEKIMKMFLKYSLARKALS